MYKFDMTDDEVANARRAGKLAQAHLKGAKLTEALTIGENLLVGSRAAMKAAGLDPADNNKPPTGRAYSEAFREWKDAFKFPRGKEEEDFYDAAIVCARHRTTADEIIAGLSVKQRSDMGVFGLAKRVRAKLREFEGGGSKPVKNRPVSWRKEVDGRLADVEERVHASEPKSASDLIALIARHEPAEFLELLRLHQQAWLERLMVAARAVAEWETGDTPKPNRNLRKARPESAPRDLIKRVQDIGDDVPSKESF
jgi:hypothetical protein